MVLERPLSGKIPRGLSCFSFSLYLFRSLLATAWLAAYLDPRGWVSNGCHNPLLQPVHAPNFKEGIVDTVMGGGDNGTNVAICGALLGAGYGRHVIPDQWVRSAFINFVCRSDIRSE
jgi:hypothetical protein